ncbi:accessory gene regulator B family protein [Clostridium sp. D2Q-14]|uniref:accessory gene regulator B family protein n=1 Tax=Anaeromonas gelatinilytica TaxID=2683194 RepID=UPI00193B088D|nr:accessory gene regulator B family protein [Anaeromonas gelatinilytica]
MIDKIVNSIHTFFIQNIDLEETDSIKLKYTLQVIISELSKVIILLIIFSFIGKRIYLVYSIITLLSIRIFTGGLHFKTYNGCLISSCFFFLIILIASINVPLNSLILVTLFVFTIISVIFLAPIPSKSRPMYSTPKIIKFKILGILSILLHYLLYLINNEALYATNSIWVLAFQALQLIIGKGVFLYENKRLKLQKGN